MVEALAEVLVPGVAVRVEVDQRQRAVPGGVGAELGERDGVVAAEDDREHAGVDERAEALLGELVGADRVARGELEVARVDARAETFGNTIVVNGKTWPVLEVEPRRYRFRLMNGCNSRFVILKLVGDPLAARPAAAALPFWQIGAEGGFLPAPVELDQLLIGLAERADVIVDFTGLTAGTELYLINEGPDEPFGGGVPGTDFPAANPDTTGQVLKFVVVPLASRDTSMPPGELTLPPFTPLGAATNTRKVSLNEEDSEVLDGVGPREALLGTMNDDGTPNALDWDEPITENPDLHAVEVWEMYNFTADAHPIHIHEVQFQVVDRQPFEGEARPPEPWETGYKDMVTAYPDEITRVKASFDQAGRYVWHCHIVEHEDNEMMRPYTVS